MKKIKSKLVYVNPSIQSAYKPSPYNNQRSQQSPSPDTKTNNKIQRTQSPVKQVQLYYKFKQKQQYLPQRYYHSVKTKKSEHQSEYNYQAAYVSNFGDQNNYQTQKLSNKRIGSTRSKRQYEEQENIDIDKLSQSIKIKCPQSNKSQSNYENEKYRYQNLYQDQENNSIDSQNNYQDQRNYSSLYENQNNHRSKINNFTQQSSNKKYATPKSNKVYLNPTYPIGNSVNIPHTTTSIGNYNQVNYFRSNNNKSLNYSSTKNKNDFPFDHLQWKNQSYYGKNTKMHKEVLSNFTPQSTNKVRYNPKHKIQKIIYNDKNKEQKKKQEANQVKKQNKSVQPQKLYSFIDQNQNTQYQQSNTKNQANQSYYKDLQINKNLPYKQKISSSPSTHNKKKKLQIYSTPVSRKSVQKKKQTQQSKQDKKQDICQELKAKKVQNNEVRQSLHSVSSKIQSQNQNKQPYDPQSNYRNQTFDNGYSNYQPYNNNYSSYTTIIQTNIDKEHNSSSFQPHYLHQSPQRYYLHQFNSPNHQIKLYASNTAQLNANNSILSDKQAYIKSLQLQNLKLKQNIHSKNKQLNKITGYLHQYQKLGQKNFMLQNQMSKIYEKLIDQKQRSNQNIHNQPNKFTNKEYYMYQSQQTKVEQEQQQQNKSQYNKRINKNRQFQYEQSQIEQQNSNHLITQQSVQSLQYYQSKTIDDDRFYEHNFNNNQSNFISLIKANNNDYIKISDENQDNQQEPYNNRSYNQDNNLKHQLNQNLPVQEAEEQSFKLNKDKMQNFNNQQKEQSSINVHNSERAQVQSKKKSTHRKNQSVGARLKQSLKANNQEFKAQFDEQTFLSSSSSIKIKQNNEKQNISQTKKSIQSEQKVGIQSSRIHSQNQKIQVRQQQNERKTQRILKYQVPQKQSQNKIKQQNVQKGSQKNESGAIKVQSQAQEQSSNKVNSKDIEIFNNNLDTEQTTKKKPKYIIKPKKNSNHQQGINIEKQQIQSINQISNPYNQKFKQQNQLNIKNLIQTNKKLTQIIHTLIHANQSSLYQIKTSQNSSQKLINHLIKYEEDISLIKLNLHELTKIFMANQKNKKKEEVNIVSVLSKQIDQKITKLFKSFDQNVKVLKKQKDQKRKFVQNSQINMYQSPPLIKLSSFGKDIKKQQQSKISFKPPRKLSGSQNPYNPYAKQPASPSFTYQQDGGSFMFQQSFKLSQTGRSNHQRHSPSNMKLQYSQMDSSPRNRSNTCNNQWQRVGRRNQLHLNSDKESKDSNLLQNSQESNGTSQFNFIEQHKSSMHNYSNQKQNEKYLMASNNKLQIKGSSSDNSQIQINFDDLYDDVHHNGLQNKYQKFEIIQRNDDHQNSSIHITQAKSIMKSSFGPIIVQKQMSISQKGDVQPHTQNQNSNQKRNQEGIQASNISQLSKYHNNQHQRYNNIRPRQNSSINIWFSSDSIIGKTNNQVKKDEVKNQLQSQSIQENNIQHQKNLQYQQLNTKFTKNEMIQTFELKESPPKNTSQLSSACPMCQHNIEALHRVEIQSNQMRGIISQLTDQRDNLKKLMKTKVQLIDQLEISLKELQSIKSLQKITSPVVNNESNQFKSMNYGNGNQEQGSYNPPSMNEFYYGKMVNLPQKTNNTTSNKSLNKSNKNLYPNYVTNHQQYYSTPPAFSFLRNEQKSNEYSISPSPNTKIMKQIEDVLPIASLLINKEKDNPSGASRSRIESLRSIELQIQEQLKKEKFKQFQFKRKMSSKRQLSEVPHGNHFLQKKYEMQGQKQRSSTGFQKQTQLQGSYTFLGADQMRQESFKITKAILLKLICLIRQFVQQSGGATQQSNIKETTD